MPMSRIHILLLKMTDRPPVQQHPYSGTMRVPHKVTQRSPTIRKLAPSRSIFLCRYSRSSFVPVLGALGIDGYRYRKSLDAAPVQERYVLVLLRASSAHLGERCNYRNVI